MGTEKSIVGVPLGAFIANRYSNGWEIAQVTGSSPKELVSCGDGCSPFYRGGKWVSVNPMWDIAISEGHPAYELLCALAAAVALGGDPDELLAQVKELCNKELQNVGT